MNSELLTKDILRAFLQDKLPAFGFTIDEELIDRLQLNIRLSIDENNLDNQYRWIFLNEGVDFRPSVESIKLYNKVQIDFTSLFRFGAAGAASLLGENLITKLLLSTFLIILDFVEKHKIKFNDDDAKVLIAIYKLNTAEFDKFTLLEFYRTWFETDINPKELDRSIAFLTRINSIEKLANDRYRRIEKVIDLDRKIF